MTNKYTIKQYTFIDKRTQTPLVILANSKKVLEIILSIERDTNILRFTKKKLTKRKRVTVSPEEIEEQQIKEAQERRRKRYNLIALLGGEL